MGVFLFPLSLSELDIMLMQLHYGVCQYGQQLTMISNRIVVVLQSFIDIVVNAG
jgi:hypothetical protein